MSAKSNSATDDEPSHGVTIAAKAYDANTPEQMLHGTEHILVDGEPLCGNHHVKKHVESGRYGTETTRHPLNGHDTCKSCGRIYVSRFGSEHDTFEQLADFEKGDWVLITTETGETMTGRVSHTADRSDFPSRRVTIVLSDEAQKRWIYGVDEEIKVRVSEGEQPVIANGSILDDDYSEEPVTEIDETSAPVDNVDERTAATLDDLEDIVGTRAKTVMTLGGDRHLFHINARESLDSQELWELLDDFYKAGYEIKGVTPGKERSGTDCAAICLIAKPLKSPLATDGSGKPASSDGETTYNDKRTVSGGGTVSWSISCPQERTAQSLQSKIETAVEMVSAQYFNQKPRHEIGQRRADTEYKLKTVREAVEAVNNDGSFSKNVEGDVEYIVEEGYYPDEWTHYIDLSGIREDQRSRALLTVQSKLARRGYMVNSARSNDDGVLTKLHVVSMRWIYDSRSYGRREGL